MMPTTTINSGVRRLRIPFLLFCPDGAGCTCIARARGCRNSSLGRGSVLAATEVSVSVDDFPFKAVQLLGDLNAGLFHLQQQLVYPGIVALECRLAGLQAVFMDLTVG